MRGWPTPSSIFKKQRTNLAKGLIIDPLSKFVLVSFYMNCSKYFSLNPVSGNLNTFCLPSLCRIIEYDRITLYVGFKEIERTVGLGNVYDVGQCNSKMPLLYGFWIQQIGKSCHITTSFLKTEGHIFRRVDVEFKDIVKLSWCRIISSTSYEQTDAVNIIIRYPFGDIRYLNIVDSFCPRFSIDAWCFSFHFS